MKKTLFLVAIFITLNSFGQIQLKETDKLAITSKIWGFLKYYHPEIGKGKINWDEQLFKILPKIKNAKNKQELSITYLNWINSLGVIDICKKCTQKNNDAYFGKNFDLNWTKNSNFFSKELISKLDFIEKNRFQGEHFYVSSFKGEGNVKIQNEPEYPNFNWEDENLRILTLFRYWNYIEYFFPYKYQMDKDWDLILNESIPNFLNTSSEINYHLAILELIVNINDTHASFSSLPLYNFFGAYMTPIKFQLIDQKAIINGFYNQQLAEIDDLQIGDVIIKVNGTKIKTILNQYSKYVNGSNNSVKLFGYSWKIFNGSTNTVKITFERNGVIHDKIIQRYPYRELNYQKPVIEKWKILNDNIGYINMGQLEKEDVNMVMDTLFKTKAIIFDIRNYPKGTVFALSEYLNKEPKKFVKFTEPDLSYIGKFNWTETISCGKENLKPYLGKVILLVDERTQSHAEFTAMALQTANNSITIGSQTSGADGNVSKVIIISNLKTYFTGVGVFYPNEKETQRIGIVPDIVVKQTIDGIKNGIDDILEKAIKIAKE